MLPVVPVHARPSHKAKASRVKPDQSHTPPSIRRWLDRQIVREITRGTDELDSRARTVHENPDAIRERWANASAAAAAALPRH